MSFKHLLEKYKNGNASAEEIRLIEDELDKYESIEEYLSDGYDLDFGKEVSKETIHTEHSYVQKSVNRKLRKVIFTSVTIVFLVLFMTFYIVSPMIGTFYYNPSQRSVGKFSSSAQEAIGKSHEDAYFDLAALTELILPGYVLTSMNTENLGFGKYNVNFERANWFTRQTKSVSIKIDKNFRELNGNYENYFGSASSFYVDRERPESDFGSMKKRTEKTIRYMEELNPVSYTSSYIIFGKDLSLDKFDKLIKAHGDKVQFKWAGVRTEDQNLNAKFWSGFNPDYTNTVTSDDTADKKKYPYIQLGDYWRDGWAKTKPNDSFVDIYTKHYTSLLKYMIDREKAVKALDLHEVKSNYYKNALKYIEKNGINVYGILIFGETRDLLEFLKVQNIRTIDIMGVLPSKYIY